MKGVAKQSQEKRKQHDKKDIKNKFISNKSLLKLSTTQKIVR